MITPGPRNMMIKCVEVTLGCYYRNKDENGNYFGGSTYTIEKGIKWDMQPEYFGIAMPEPRGEIDFKGGYYSTEEVISLKASSGGFAENETKYGVPKGMGTVLLWDARTCFIERTMKVFCIKIKKKKAVGKISRQMKEYRDGALYIRKHLRVLAKNIAVTAVQLVAIYSVTYFVYRALGCSGEGWLTISSLQALLSAGIAAVPLPGGTGAGEGAFKMIFSSIFIGSSLIPGMRNAANGSSKRDFRMLTLRNGSKGIMKPRLRSLSIHGGRKCSAVSSARTSISSEIRSSSTERTQSGSCARD